MNYARELQNRRAIRDQWLNILVGTPDSLEAAQYVAKINGQIELLESLKTFSGDYGDD